ncbi:MAG: hypothetical protein P1U68_17825 [Verrucomicrobiales bacterium]|nr:hypothetical protein [Verrucomicrobiales bacterium]
MKTCLRVSLFAAVLSLSLSAEAQSNSAREALGVISAQFGPRSTQWLAEMRGTGGVPQPYEWDIVAFDERAPRLLYRFRAGGGRATDMGLDRQIYPDLAPAGYFSPNQIGVDSVAAFTIAEGEARKAKMAFDSCNYILNARDFSTEPIWQLELVDTRRAVVGKIFLSANSGAVLRTIWVYRDQRARSDGEPLILDSFAPTQRSTHTGITGNDYPVTPPSPGADTGITGMPHQPAPPTPRMTTPPISSVPQQPASPPVYRPVPPSGSVMNDTGAIPEPPAISTPPTTSAPAPAPGGMVDLRDDVPAATRPDPTKPPIDVPTGSGSGSSERIPPPPIPQ